MIQIQNFSPEHRLKHSTNPSKTTAKEEMVKSGNNTSVMKDKRKFELGLIVTQFVVYICTYFISESQFSDVISKLLSSQKMLFSRKWPHVM
jgi:hypothetical protein